MAAGALKLTIDHTKVDADLNNIPIVFNLGTSSGTGSYDATALFTELGSAANRKKIKVTTSDHATQCYAEIEPGYDFVNKKMVLHVKAPSVSSSADTVFYLDYDSTFTDNTAYIGDTGDAAAQAVWDSNYKLVSHMANDPSGGTDCIKDSTSNGNHGTPVGTLDLVDSVLGKALQMGGGAESVRFTGALVNEWQIESFVDLDSGNTDPVLFTNGWAYLSGKGVLVRYDQASGAWKVYSGNSNQTWPTSILPTDPVLMTFNLDDFDYKIRKWQDAVYPGDPKNIGIQSLQDSYIYAGSELGAQKGLIGKYISFRVSDVRRADAWIKATSYSLHDDLILLETSETFNPPATGEQPVIFILADEI